MSVPIFLDRVGKAGWVRRAAPVISLVFILTVGVLPAMAQETVAELGAGRYFSSFWLVMLILQCAAWIGIYDWVGRDNEQLKRRPRFWCTAIMSAGGAGMVLMLMVDMAFVFASLIALLAIFVIYVVKRNRDLPPERRVLTWQHLGYLLRNLAERLHLRRTAGAVIQKAGRADTTEIQLLRKDGTNLDKLSEDRAGAGPSEAVVAVKELIESAVLSRATDIHIEPKEGEVQARFRIDGILHNVPSYPSELAAPMISGVKVLAEMDIAEKRKPQDGTFMARLGNRAIDFRVATTPSVHGETMVIRLLDRSVGLIRLDSLGLPPMWQKNIHTMINAAHGMLIVSGPTGSGKTTTLYAMVGEMDAFQKNIVTVEDPIEYRLDNVTQTQVNPKAGITFAGTLRSFLRQDPDVMMVGEIRDAETARVALQAAMTGHFVLTTIHANEAVTSLFRLLDLGVESYLISASLTAILAQRLVRILCPACKVPYVPEADFLRKIGVKPAPNLELYKAQGCDECQGTGYRGRVGVFELFELNDTIKDLVRTNPSLQLMKDEARKVGWRPLQETGLVKVVGGITSLRELVRVTK